ncbi:MAG TPA: hypothetical protein GXX19_00155 [Syntrophomonadaceae bacterium]|nr:hypothetical protein [Syntrophomonadaceae bacterium]
MLLKRKSGWRFLIEGVLLSLILFAAIPTNAVLAGGGGGSGGSEQKQDEPFTISFFAESVDPENTVICLDGSNGFDERLNDNLSLVTVSKKQGGGSVSYKSFEYIKSGGKDNPPMIRRLRLIFDNLEPSTSYQVKVGGGFAANNGVTLGRDCIYEFTTSGMKGTAGEAGAPANKEVSSRVSSRGGTVEGNGLIVNIPPGAVNGEVNIVLSKVEDLSGLALMEGAKLLSSVFEVNKDDGQDFEKPVTLTLDFDPSRFDPNMYDIGIFWLDEKTGTWRELENIRVDLASGKVSGDVKHFTKFAVLAVPKKVIAEDEQVPEFKDIKGYWCEKGVKRLAAMKILRGYPDGTFRPDSRITRSEFTTILVKAFKVEQKGALVFDDVSHHWAKDFVASAFNAGIVAGYDRSHFHPDDFLTREQMAVMVCRAAGLKAGAGSAAFSDSAVIAPWAKDAVAAVGTCGIMSGYPDGTFRPGNFATRAEAASVIERALHL